jgi:hypothetical protein
VSDNDVCSKPLCRQIRRAHVWTNHTIAHAFVEPVPAPQPPADGAATIRERAIALFRPPFRFEMGYVWDAAGEMVSDNRVDPDDVASLPTLRVRGWGRIGYLPDPAALQDEAGRLIAEALTKGWPK